MVTLMLSKGCPMFMVQELLDHEDLATTQTYVKVTVEHKHQLYEKYFINNFVLNNHPFGCVFLMHG